MYSLFVWETCFQISKCSLFNSLFLLNSDSPFLNTERHYANLYEMCMLDDEDDIVPEPALPEDKSASLSAKDVVKAIRSKVIPDQVARFNICRQSIWEGTARAMLRKSFRPNCTILVQFTDMCKKQEGAIDQGGPRREFLRLLLQFLHTSKLFSGSEKLGKTLSHNTKGIFLIFFLVCVTKHRT